MAFTLDKRFEKCTNENSFKMLYLKKASNASDFYAFPIETEETVKGFPDVICIEKATDKASFLEFKFTYNGTIHFQSTQPAFYKKYGTMPILIVAYNKKTRMLHTFMSSELFKKTSPYYLNGMCSINLIPIEEVKK